MTLYSAELFVVVFSPGTGWTSTLTVVGTPNGTALKSLKTTVFVSPALMMSIVLLLTIGAPVFAIVSVTLMLNSWNDPESITATRNARSVVEVTVFSALGSSRFPSGSAVTDTRALPWSPAGVVVVAVP